MCDYNSNTAYKIYHAPIELEGTGFLLIRASAGYGYIVYFLNNWQTPTEYVGTSFRIVVAWSQYQAGT